ncbi:MAG: DUF805 domain-containing protein [Polyangiales bacterium]
MRHAFDFWSFEGRVSRTRYVIAGVILFLMKYGLDLALSMRFGQPWNLLVYVSPRLHPLLRAGAVPPTAYVVLLFLIAVPFAWAGVSLSARRLRDAGVNPFWAGLFFLPFLHLAFFLVLAIAPPRGRSAEGGARDPYREVDEEAPPSRALGLLERWIPRSAAGSFFVGTFASLLLGLTCFVITARIDHVLGGWLFVGVPFGMGFLTSFATTYGGRAKMAMAVAYALLTQLVATLVLIAFAWEGIACIVMAMPILGGLTILGAVVGHMSARHRTGFRAEALSIALLPALVAVDAQRGPDPQDFAVVSEVRIAAPPEVVWKNVVSFPPISAPPKPIFAIVAMPLEAKIDGKDPGATRRCVFTNGTFYEPIKVWDEPRELTFGVAAQPGNLDPYIDVTKGQFLLTRNDDGSTSLRGTTWYRLKVHPSAYWKVWSDTFLHAIHMRVLDHVKDISEHPEHASAPPTKIPSWMETAHQTCNCTTVSAPR